MKQQKQQEPSEFKTVPFMALKVPQGLEDQGIVDHMITVFGILDLGKDISHPGSFTKTLAERSGRVRVLDSHQRGSVMNILGKPISIEEVGRAALPPEVLEKYPEATGGVKARTQFLLDTPEGRGAFARIKAGVVEEFSYGYDTLDSDDSTIQVEGKDVRVRNLRTIRLWEYSPVIFGMNPATTVMGAKGAGEGDPTSSEGEGDPPAAPVLMNGGDEGKPAPDVTENTIRMRVRDPGAFQEGSFRTVNIGDKGNGISAVMGRLKGETTMTIQSYVFDKKKWTTESASKWVADHKKVLVIILEGEGARGGDGGAGGAEGKSEGDDDAEPGGPDKCVCPKCDYEVNKKRGVPCRSVKCPKCGAKLVAKADGDGDDDSDEGKGVTALDLITIEMSQIEIELANAEAGPATE